MTSATSSMLERGGHSLIRMRELLDAALAEAGIEASAVQRDLLSRHLMLVIEKNRAVNLTRITDVKDGIYLHIIDSLLLMDAFFRAPEGSFVDMGTGAGFPGIPLAIMTGRPAVLIDSVGKKVVAVQEFLEALGLEHQVSAHHMRVEDLGHLQRESHALVTARAVAQTNVLVEYAAPLLQENGRLVVAKAHPTEDELQRGDAAARICGLKRVSRETFELPEGRGHREILSFERIGRARVSLPRAVGTAKRQPLG